MLKLLNQLNIQGGSLTPLGPDHGVVLTEFGENPVRAEGWAPTGEVLPIVIAGQVHAAHVFERLLGPVPKIVKVDL